MVYLIRLVRRLNFYLLRHTDGADDVISPHVMTDVI